jgi:hypothetical protein
MRKEGGPERANQPAGSSTNEATTNAASNANPGVTLLDAAKAWVDAGFCVVPSHEDRGKRPFGRWKQYQVNPLPWKELEALLETGKFTGIGVITGTSSGNAEVIEIEGPAGEARQRLQKVIKKAREFDTDGDSYVGDLLSRLLRGCVEYSAGGGIHFFIRVVDGPALPNTKLAYVSDATAESGKKIVSETRGEHGFCIVAPTSGRNGHRQGAMYALARGRTPADSIEVTSEDRDALHLLFTMALNEVDDDDGEQAKPERKAATSIPAANYGASPFDAYRETPWREILEPEGWTWSHTDKEGRDHWVRPGKKKPEGTSATTLEDGPMYVFSTNAGLPTERGLSKGDVYAHIHHGGDTSAAARDLRDQGFGGNVYPQLTSWLWEPTETSPSLEDLVFDTTSELRYIRDHARHTMVSPWALLGCTIATVIAYTEPNTNIPAYISAPASLNTGVVLASESGGGKTSAMDVAEVMLADTVPEVIGTPSDPDLLGTGDDTTAVFSAPRTSTLHRLTPSSGEGIIALFVNTSAKGEQTQTRTRVLSTVDEIATLAGQSSRQGSTLMPLLRSALSGAHMSTHAAEGSRQRTLHSRKYRWCLVVATQKRTVAHFLDGDGIDAGTPQRFLWCRATDPKADDAAPPAGTNPFIGWSAPHLADEVSYPGHVRDLVRKAHAARQRGEGDALDGHAMLTRLKVAAGLALIHSSHPNGVLTVTDQLWEISGHIMRASDLVRGHLLSSLEQARDDAITARKRSEARAEDAVHDDRAERCALIIGRKIQKTNTPLTRSEVKDAAGRYKPVWRAGLNMAIERGWVAAIPVDGTSEPGHRYVSGEVSL